jgi:hypothetical protein
MRSISTGQAARLDDKRDAALYRTVLGSGLTGSSDDQVLVNALLTLG